MTKTENKDVIVDKYKKLVCSIANSYNKHNNFDDLFQVGCIGLMNAYDNFDCNMNCKFSTYAYSYIVGEIKKYNREDKTIKTSREISTLSYKIEEVRILLSQKLMREPTMFELALYLEIDESKLVEALSINKPVISFDEPIMTNEGEVNFYEKIPALNNYDVDGLIDLKDAVSLLNPIEQSIIRERFVNDKTQQDIANLLSISQVQVYRNEQKIIKKLKNNLYS